jgi:hypothetical protein
MITVVVPTASAFTHPLCVTVASSGVVVYQYCRTSRRIILPLGTYCTLSPTASVSVDLGSAARFGARAADLRRGREQRERGLVFGGPDGLVIRADAQRVGTAQAAAVSASTPRRGAVRPWR